MTSLVTPRSLAIRFSRFHPSIGTKEASSYTIVHVHSYVAVFILQNTISYRLLWVFSYCKALPINGYDHTFHLGAWSPTPWRSRCPNEYDKTDKKVKTLIFLFFCDLTNPNQFVLRNGLEAVVAKLVLWNIRTTRCSFYGIPLYMAANIVTTYM